MPAVTPTCRTASVSERTSAGLDSNKPLDGHKRGGLAIVHYAKWPTKGAGIRPDLAVRVAQIPLLLSDSISTLRSEARQYRLFGEPNQPSRYTKSNSTDP